MKGREYFIKTQTEAASMVKLAPSILSADFSALGRDIQLMEKGGADYVHVDVMDGHFVPNLSMGPVVVRSLKKVTKLPFDVHLMISNPEKYADAFMDAGADILTVHAEAVPEDRLPALISHIRGRGVKPSLCIKPKTTVESILKYLPELSMILVMTVEPGFGGQSMLPETLDKVRELRSHIDRVNPECELEVDGGIYPENVHLTVEAGANVIVAGSAVFSKGDIVEAARTFKRIFGE
jgi:ribulose-phosphate 3-epimerase